MQKKVLEMRGICKSFPGVDVFDCFDFDLLEGEIHCICGENGAGKSTLIKMLSGAYKPDNGNLFLDGKLIDNLNPHMAIQLGIQTIYQEHNLYPLLSVMENLFVGNEISKGILLNNHEMIEVTNKVLCYLNSTISPHDIVGELGAGEKKLVEIARGLVSDSKIMILDEPTASFSQKEISHLLKVVKTLAKEGVSIIYISHHLDEVFEIADRVTVMRDGHKINTYQIEDLDEETLIKDMVGRELSAFYYRDKVDKGEVMFEAKNFSGNGVKDASLYVRKGELLGLSGMVGSGRTELAELLFGVKKKKTGVIKINGKEVNIKTPLDAIENYMCFITEDRQHTGLFLEHSVLRNSLIASYANLKSPFVKPLEEIEKASYYVSQMNIVTPSIEQQVTFLSGGNQQKVVLAKWFATKGEIFIFDEPTRGIDIGAKEEIYKLMTDLLKDGKCIIMISSDMPELIAMSDRVMVMRQGEIVAEIGKEQMNEADILKFSIGGC